MTSSESCWDSQKKAEAPATSSNEPSTRATVTSVTETPVTETPAARSDDTPAPMETGEAGDSRSWAKWVWCRGGASKGQAREALPVTVQEVGGKTDASFPPPRQ